MTSTAGPEPRSSVAVTVCYAPPPPAVPVQVALQVTAGTTLGQVILSCRHVEGLADVDVMACRTGIWGKLKPLETILRDQDRVELYRPLIADPMEARRRRAGKKGFADTAS